MPIRFEPRNYGIFELVGSLYKNHNLPLIIRRKLGFLLLNAIDGYAENLIKSYYGSEGANDLASQKDADEMLDNLRLSYTGPYSNMSRNQTFVVMIEEEFKIVHEDIEDELEIDNAKRSFRILLENTLQAELYPAPKNNELPE